MRGLVIPALLEQMKHLTGSDARNVSAGQRGVTDSVDEAGEAHGVECGGKKWKSTEMQDFWFGGTGVVRSAAFYGLTFLLDYERK